MRRPPARVTVTVVVVLAGGGIVLGAGLPWLTTTEGLRGPAALDSGYGRGLAALGVAVAVGGVAMTWRDTVAARRVVLVAALTATLLAGWMLAQAEGRYATLVDEVPAAAERGPGGFLALAAALVATGGALVERPVPAQHPDERPARPRLRTRHR